MRRSGVPGFWWCSFGVAEQPSSNPSRLARHAQTSGALVLVRDGGIMAMRLQGSGKKVGNWLERVGNWPVLC